MAKPTVGVLALQGAFAKHMDVLRQLNVTVQDVRRPEELIKCDALIIPGGESTTMMRQIAYINLQPELNRFAQEKPIFGTCAGLILMSQEIISDEMQPFGWLKVSIERNAYGRQYDSFQADVELKLKEKKENFPAVFIRAPKIHFVSDDVKILAKHAEQPILVQQNLLLGATFHPELTSNPLIHEYFLKMIP